MNLYGLIGYPLSHSFSEQYFTEKFEREGLTNCVFKAFPITAIQHLPALLQDNPLLKGFGVTIPYKEQVLQYLTRQSDEVKIIGATNSIKISDNILTGYNTDIIGFEKSFVELLKPHHKKALILGTGGASRAVQYVLNKLGLGFLLVSRRSSPEKNNQINYRHLTQEIMQQYEVIINCSPRGTWPDDDDCPDIPYDFITQAHYAFDLVYKPAKTLFLKKAEQQGALVKNGYDMLLIQAEESWKIWNS